MSGNVIQTFGEFSNQVSTVCFSCIGDSIGGSIPNTTMSDDIYRKIRGMFLNSVEAIPGNIKPAVDSDIKILDEFGYDMLGGNGIDLLNNISPTMAKPNVSNRLDGIPVKSKITISVENQSVNSAQYDIICVFTKTL